MSYAAEPFARFVEDLLVSLTGGEVRTRFTFLPEEEPFALNPPGPVLRSSLRVYGQADGSYHAFLLDRDFELTSDGTLLWLQKADGTPAADATWPDPGTPFFVNYDHTGPRIPGPRLTDRNPGSVTRLLAETFGREYAVLSRQLEGIYLAGFLDTATGRDLDQIVALLGIQRRDRTFATGTAVFSRTSPAPADVFIPDGTRLSSAEPPPAVFETAEPRTLRRGTLSVEAPIRALTPGSAGVVPERLIRVIHRPIFGVDSVANPQSTSLSGDAETDETVRRRARRALETAGQATTGALLGALATVPGVREKDVRIEEDHLERPGVITMNVAVRLEEDLCRQAVDVVTQSRPAGIRVLHNLDCSGPPGAPTPGDNEVEVELEANDLLPTEPGAEGLFFPSVVEAVLLPSSGSLSGADRSALRAAGETVVADFVAEAGIGEPLIYNRLVAELMALDGVQDVTLSIYRAGFADPSPVHRNLHPGSTLRPSIDPAHGGASVVRVGGQLIAVDVTASIQLQGAGLLGDLVANIEDARLQVVGQLSDAVEGLDELSVPALRGAIVESESWTIPTLSFRVEWLEEGVRDHREFTESDAGFPVDPLHRPWLRSVEATGT